jgi:hypothetical protein
MKTIALLTILIAMSLPRNVPAADDYKLADLAQAQSGDLVLAGFGGKETAAVIAAPPIPAIGTKQVYVINAYLINRGKKPITVLLGTEEQIGPVWVNGVLTIAYTPSYWNGFSDVSVKPRIEDFRPIILNPGEVAQLPTKKVESTRTPIKLRIGYGVPAAFEKYGVWSGNVAVEIPLPKFDEQ